MDGCMDGKGVSPAERSRNNLDQLYQIHRTFNLVLSSSPGG